MNRKELYALCCEHGSVMMAERDGQIVVDWLPNLHVDMIVLGEIVFGDILIGEYNPDEVSDETLTVYPYFDWFCPKGSELRQLYTDILRKQLIQYLDSEER